MQTDEGTGGHDKASSCFSKWSEGVQKLPKYELLLHFVSPWNEIFLSSSQSEDVAPACRSRPNVQNSLTFVSILNQNTPVYAFNSYFFNIHLKRITLSTSAFSKLSLSFKFPDKPL